MLYRETPAPYSDASPAPFSEVNPPVYNEEDPTVYSEESPGLYSEGTPAPYGDANPTLHNDGNLALDGHGNLPSHDYGIPALYSEEIPELYSDVYGDGSLALYHDTDWAFNSGGRPRDESQGMYDEDWTRHSEKNLKLSGDRDLEVSSGGPGFLYRGEPSAVRREAAKFDGREHAR